MREAFVSALSAAAKVDRNIVLITGDLGFGVLEKFAVDFPDQFFNAGVAEQSMMGMAAGLASTGKRVFVYSIGNFPTLRCLEQIRNDVCNMNNSVVVVSVGAGYSYGPQGYTHHALEDIAAMRALPNIEIISPADPIETALLTTQLAKSSTPSYLRLGKSKELTIHNNDIELTPGKFVKVSDGDHGTIIFTGSVGSVAMDAKADLLANGMNVGVFSSPYISKIDVQTIEARAALGPMVIVEEHSVRGGFGSAVLEALNTHRVIADIRLVFANQHNLALIGDQKYLREANGISADAISKHFSKK